MIRRAIVCFAATVLFAAASRVAGQDRAEVEVERRDRTVSRLEVYHGAVPIMRVEREIEDSAMQRVSVRLPGPAVGLDGYAALALEDGLQRNKAGLSFEVGRGVPALGGSIERAGDERFTGAYLKLRWPNLEIAGGGGDHDGDFIQHGGLYVKGARWSAVLGGAHGANGVNLEHFAATWHPVQRGGAPGGRFIAERRTSERWSAELMFTDRASFNHFATWGQFGIAEYPHRKSFEVADDITRYVRPPIFLHGYTTGVLATSIRYQRVFDARELTLDLRTFPVRALHAQAATSQGARGYFVDRVLPSIMVGAFRRTKAKNDTLLTEIGLPPFSVYVEVPRLDGAHTYVFVQYRQGL